MHSYASPQKRTNTGPGYTRRRSPSPVGSASRFPTQPESPSPQSQSFSRSYGSILPTSLTYVILLARGFSPWRPASDMGTTLHEINTPLPQIFKGLPERTGRLKGSAALPRSPPYLSLMLFHGLLLCQKEKRTVPFLEGGRWRTKEPLELLVEKRG